MPRDTVAEIKDRLSIVDVVSPYVRLTKAGKSLKGLCPFHKEKTASFNVSPERGTFHCFGCGEGGDAFTFIEKIEGVDFKGALALLAEKAGVEIVYSPEAAKDRSKEERLREAVARAAEFYAARLTGSRAEAYAKERGLLAESVRAWNLGYAPDAWRDLLEHLGKLGFTTEEMLAAGLIKEAAEKRGTYYDRFRNRLVFPIADRGGRTVGFTGRVLPEGGQGPSEEAKYLNSPETALFKKSELLFGLDRAKDAIRARGFALLVEGQMDVLLAHQAGFANAIALSGTALTDRHVRLLMRYSSNLMLVLDADAAGLSATAKSAELALSEGMKVKVVALPEGHDPADLLSSGGEKGFAERLKGAKPAVDFFLAALAEKERDPHRLVNLAERVVLPLIRAVKSPMERDHFIETTARALGLSAEAVRGSLAALGKSPPAAAKEQEAAPGKRASREEVLLAALEVYQDTPLAERVRSEYARIIGSPPSLGGLPESARFLAAEMFGEAPGEDAADDLLRAFEEAVIREAHEEALRALRRAEHEGEEETVKKIQAQLDALNKRLGKLGR